MNTVVFYASLIKHFKINKFDNLNPTILTTLSDESLFHNVLTIKV